MTSGSADASLTSSETTVSCSDSDDCIVSVSPSVSLNKVCIMASAGSSELFALSASVNPDSLGSA